MSTGRLWLCLCVLGILAVPCLSVSKCLNGTTINVILLDDNESPWSLKYVQKEIQRAIGTENADLAAEGADLNLTAKYGGFNTALYRYSGCHSTTMCEGLEELKNLMSSEKLGCAILGPTCTYTTFQIVDVEKGLKLRTPIISAGSFGLSCDYTLNLQRLLPPARKISDFFINFWSDNSTIKSRWETAYVYKKPTNTEDCFW